MFGNRVLQIGVHRAHETLVLLAESEVVVEPGGPPARGEPWEVVAMRVGELRGGDALSVRPFAGSSPYVAARPSRRRRCGRSPRRRSRRTDPSSTAPGTCAT